MAMCLFEFVNCEKEIAKAVLDTSTVSIVPRLFEMENIKLTVDEGALNFMVEKALEFKLGARGLRSICEHILTDAMFEMPGTNKKELHLTLEYATKKFDKSKLSKLKVA